MNRLQKIAQLVRSMDLDALLLTHEENMQYATLFPHLEGMVLVLRSGEGVCFTDSRYIENATLVMAPQGYRVPRAPIRRWGPSGTLSPRPASAPWATRTRR